MALGAEVGSGGSLSITGDGSRGDDMRSCDSVVIWDRGGVAVRSIADRRGVVFGSIGILRSSPYVKASLTYNAASDDSPSGWVGGSDGANGDDGGDPEPKPSLSRFGGLASVKAATRSRISSSHISLRSSAALTLVIRLQPVPPPAGFALRPASSDLLVDRRSCTSA